MEGVALQLHLTLAAGLFGGGNYSDVYTWLDPPRTGCGFGYGSPWSPAGLVNALEAIVSLAARLWGGTCTGGVVVVIIVHLEWGSSSSSNTHSLWAEPDIKHFYINKPRAWVRGGPRSPPFLLQTKPGTGDPKSRPTATSWRRVRRLIRLSENF